MAMGVANFPAGWNNPRVEYVDQHQSDTYICCHCNKMVYQPVQVPCGHRLCSPCINELLAAADEIPCPGNEIDGDQCETINKYNMFPDFATFRDMCKMMVYCPNRDSGCKHKCKFTNLQNHLNECAFKKTKCPVEGCEFQGGSSALESHMESSAAQHVMLLAKALTNISTKQEEEMQSLREENRSLQGERKQMEELKEENKRLADDNQTMQRRLQTVETDLNQIREHRSSSSTPVVDDLVNQFQALQNKQLTMDLDHKKLYQLVMSDRSRMTGVNVTGAQSTVYRTLYEWHITNYTQRKNSEIAGKVPYLDSEVFYCNRYKMCARMYLNGDGIGRGSNLSLYLSLLKGENDEQLIWPFKYRICMVLVNQINPNQKIVQEQFDPVATSISYQKPTSRNKGTGFPLFSTHALAESAQCLVNDSIKILIQVDSSVFD